MVELINKMDCNKELFLSNYVVFHYMGEIITNEIYGRGILFLFVT